MKNFFLFIFSLFLTQSFGQTPANNPQCWTLDLQENFNQKILFPQSGYRFVGDYNWGPALNLDHCIIENGTHIPNPGRARSCSHSEYVDWNNGVMTSYLTSQDVYNVDPNNEHYLDPDYWEGITYNSGTGLCESTQYLYFPMKEGTISSKENPDDDFSGTFHYGYFTVKLRLTHDLPEMAGGFWLFEAGCVGGKGAPPEVEVWDWYGEIDIVELWKGYPNIPYRDFGPGKPYASAGIHSKLGYFPCDSKEKNIVIGQQGIPNKDIEQEFIEFSIEWAPNYVIWFRDNKPFWFIIEEPGVDNLVSKSEMRIFLQTSIDSYLHTQAEYVSLQNNPNMPGYWQWKDLKYYKYNTAKFNPISKVISSKPLLNSLFTNIYSDMLVSSSTPLVVNSSENKIIRIMNSFSVGTEFTVQPDNNGCFLVLPPNFNSYPPNYQ